MSEVAKFGKINLLCDKFEETWPVDCNEFDEAKYQSVNCVLFLSLS